MAQAKLTIELDNYGAFKTQISTMKRIVTELNTALGSLDSALTAANVSFANFKIPTLFTDKISNAFESAIKKGFGDAFKFAASNLSKGTEFNKFTADLSKAVKDLVGISIPKKTVDDISSLQKIISTLVLTVKSVPTAPVDFVPFVTSLQDGLNKLTAITFDSTKVESVSKGVTVFGDLMRAAKSASAIGKTSDAEMEVFLTIIRQANKLMVELQSAMQATAQFTTVSFNPMRLADMTKSTGQFISAFSDLLNELRLIREKGVAEIIKDTDLPDLLQGIGQFSYQISLAFKSFKLLDTVQLPGTEVKPVSFEGIASILKNIPLLIDTLTAFRENSNIGQRGLLRSLLAVPSFSIFGEIYRRWYGLSDVLMGITPFMQTLSQALASFKGVDMSVIDKVRGAIEYLPQMFTSMGQMRKDINNMLENNKLFESSSIGGILEKIDDFTTGLPMGKTGSGALTRMGDRINAFAESFADFTSNSKTGLAVPAITSGIKGIGSIFGGISSALGSGLGYLDSKASIPGLSFLRKNIANYTAMSDMLYGFSPMMKTLARGLGKLQDLPNPDSLNRVTQFMEQLPKFLGSMNALRSGMDNMKQIGDSIATAGHTATTYIGKDVINDASEVAKRIGLFGAIFTATGGPGTLYGAITTFVTGGPLAGLVALPGLLSPIGMALGGSVVLGGLFMRMKQSYRDYFNVSDSLLGLSPAMKNLVKAMNTLKDLEVSPDLLQKATDSLKNMVEAIGKFFALSASLNFGEKVGGIGFGKLKIFQHFRVADDLAPLLPIFRAFATALNEFKGIDIPNPDNLAKLMTAIISSITTISSMGDTSAMRKGGLRGALFVQLTNNFKDIPRAAKVIAEAMRALADIPNTENLAGVSSAVDSLMAAIKRIREDKVSIDKKTGQEIKDTFTTLSVALKSFDTNGFDAKAFESAARGLGTVMRVLLMLKSFTGSELSDLAGNLKTSAPSIANAMQVIGKMTDEGLIKGIKSGKGEVAKETEDLIQDGVINVAEKETETHSPSRWAERLGRFIGAGLGMGLENAQTGVVSSAKSLMSGMMRSLVDGAKAAFNSTIGQVILFGRDISLRMGETIQNVGRNISQTGQNLWQGGKNLAITGGIAGLILGPQMNDAAQFQQVANQIRVFGDLTKSELANVQNEILDFSAKTMFDPQQSATAFLDLQKAGLSVEETLSVLPNVGNLAAASNQTLESTTKGVVAAAQIFNIAMSDSERVVNAYIQAANKSSAEVPELAEAIANGGAVANQFGLSLEQTVAILGMWSDAGIRGAEAGSQLKSMLNGLTNPTKATQATFKQLGVSLTDTQGNFKDINTIINELNSAMNKTQTVTRKVTTGLGQDQAAQLEMAEKAYTSATRKIALYESGLSSASEKSVNEARRIAQNAESIMTGITGSQTTKEITAEISRTQAQNFNAIKQLAGTFGQTGLAVLLSQDEDAINNFVAEMQQLPDAATIATEMMSTFAGTLDSLRGSIQTLIIKAFIPLMEYVLQPLLEVGIKVINFFAGLPTPILAAAAGVVLLVTALSTLIGVGMMVVGAVLLPLGLALQGIGIVFAGLIAAFMNPLGAILGIIGIGVALTSIIVISASLVAGLSAASAMLISFFDSMRASESVQEAWAALTQKLGELKTAITDTVSSVMDFWSMFWGESEGAKKSEGGLTKVVDLFNKIGSAINDVLNPLREFQQLMELATSFKELDNQTEQEALLARRSELQREVYNAENRPTGSTVETQKTYTVQQGDSLRRIAEQNGMELSDLIALNDETLGTRTVYAGEAQAEYERLNQAMKDGTLSAEDYNAALHDLPKTTLRYIRAGDQLVLGTQAQSAALSDAEQELKRVNEQIINNASAQSGANALLTRYGMAPIEGTQRERRQSRFQEMARAFGQTSLGQTLGFNEENTIEKLGIIESKFNNLRLSVDLLKTSIVGVFTGQDGAMKDFGKNLGLVAFNATTLIEDLTGVDISNSLQEKLLEGDWKGIGNAILNKLKNVVFSVAESFVESLTSIVAVNVRSNFNVIDIILSSIGVDTGGQVANFGAKLGETLTSTVSFAFEVLKGNMSMKDAFKSLLDIWFNPSQIRRITGFLSVIGGQFQEFFDELTTFAKSPEGQSLVGLLKLIGQAVAIIGVAIGGVAIFALYAAFSSLLEVIVPVLDLLGSLVLMFEGIVTLNPEKTIEGAKSALSALVDIILGPFRGVQTALAAVFELAGMDAFAERIRGVGTTLQQLGVIILYTITQAANSAGMLFDIFVAATGRVADAFANIDWSATLDWFIQGGKDLFNGLVDGLEDGIGTLDFMWVWNAFKDAMGISSPSTLFMKGGEFLMQGLEVGLEFAKTAVINKIIEIATSLKDKFDINSLREAIISGLGTIFEFHMVGLDMVGKAVSNISSFVSSIFSAAVASITNIDTSAIQSSVVDILASVFSALPEIPELDLTKATAFIDGIRNFLQNSVIDGLGEVANAASSVIDTATGIFNQGVSIFGLGGGGGDENKSTESGQPSGLSLTITGITLPEGIGTMIADSINLLSQDAMILAAAQNLGTSIGNALASGVGNLAGLVEMNIRNPILSAIGQAQGAVQQAINNIIPDSAPLEIRVWMPSGWETFASRVEIPNPFAGAQNREFGGPMIAGNPYQYNENGLPFEIVRSNDKSWILPNKNMTMHSPRGNGQYGVGGQTINNSIGQVNVTVMPNELTPEGVARVVAEGIERFQRNNTAEYSIMQGGI